ncbi:class I adenylate-forming enzyme family protein [Gordonia sp. CPCC 206044]|uniref:class I adenylate-forming enzyme family protein n=1 Tax=Gordonia sp. CPCC 206044 TaxID=3140793 RepID=UPI003AF39FFC
MTTSPVTDQFTFVGRYEDDERLADLVGPGCPFEVETVEIDGVPVRSFAHAPATLVDLFEMAAAHDDKIYLVLDDARLTYGEIRRQAAGLSRALRDVHGVKPGDRVAVAMRNLPEFVTTLWAAALSGAIFVPLNAWWQGPELARALDEARPSVVIADSERADRLRTTGYELSPMITVGAGASDEHAFDVLTSHPPLTRDDYAVPAPDDPNAILFTSGTTGNPKGVVTTHRGTIANIWNMMFMPVRDMTLNGGLPTATASSGQRSGILTTPLFHIGGLAAVLGAAISGAKTVLLRRWDVDEAMRIVADENVTGLGGVPTIAREMLEHPRIRHFADQIATFTMGAASVPPDLPRLVHDVLGEQTQLFNGYGSTETTSSVISNVGAEYASRRDSVGRLNMTAELRVERIGGGFVGAGELGQLCIRSPQTTRGYWNNPDATADAFVDGWFRTGDLGYIDEAGFVYVVDRVKDVIIRGGENVYCAEVEGVLFEHPSVTDVAVVGIADPTMGELVCAVVIPRAGACPELSQLREFAGARLAAFKCPEAMYVTDDVPRTATGKIAKKELKKKVDADLAAVERSREPSRAPNRRN